MVQLPYLQPFEDVNSGMEEDLELAMMNSCAEW